MKPDDLQAEGRNPNLQLQNSRFGLRIVRAGADVADFSLSESLAPWTWRVEYGGHRRQVPSR